MEQETLIYVEEKDKEEARILSKNFLNEDVRNRAYINTLGAELGLKYLSLENINNNKTCNLHNVRKILEGFDISDIVLSNIHIDVRVIFDENYIFIPKSHFEYDILPDVYLVMELSRDYSHAKFLGFFEPELINKNNSNDKYYFIEKEKLTAPANLKDFIENFKGNTIQSLSKEDNDNAKLLMISLLDQNISSDDIKGLFRYLFKSQELRDEFIEFENFETLSYKAERFEESIKVTSDDETLDITLDEVSTADNFEDVQDIETVSNNDVDDTLDIAEVAADALELNDTVNGVLESGVMDIGEEVLENIEDNIEDISLPQFEAEAEAETTDFSDIEQIDMPQNIEGDFEQLETCDLPDEVPVINSNEEEVSKDTVNFESINAEVGSEVPEEVAIEDNSVSIEDIQQVDTETESLVNEEISYPNQDSDLSEFNDVSKSDEDFNITEPEQEYSEDLSSDLTDIRNEIDNEFNIDSEISQSNDDNLQDQNEVQYTQEVSNITDLNQEDSGYNNQVMDDNNFVEKDLDELENIYEQETVQDDLSTQYVNNTLQSDKSEIETLFNVNSDVNHTEYEEEAKFSSPMLNNPKNSGSMFKLVATALIVTLVIGGACLGFIKNKSNSDSLATSQSDVPVSQPETDNGSLLTTNPEVDTMSATEATLGQKMTPEQVQSTSVSSVSKTSKPINATGSYMSVQKISWSTPEYLSYSNKIKDYLQTAGKSIKLTLSSDLLLVNEFAYSNTVKVSMVLSNDGNIKDIKIVKSSGSKQIDELVLQTVKDTLNVIKPATGEVPTSQFSLGLTINF